MLVLEQRMAGHQLPAVADMDLPSVGEHVHLLPDQREGDGVPIGLERHQVVAGHDAANRHPYLEGGLSRRGNEPVPLPCEPVDGPLVGRAVDPDVRHGGHPLGELLVEVDPIDEGAPREEVALYVLDPALHLSLGLGPVGGAQARLEPPVVGKRFEGGVPADPAAVLGPADRAGTVVEMLPGVPSEVIEGLFVRLEERTDPLVGAGAVKRAPGKTKGQGEQVKRPRAGAKRDPSLSPVDLALQSRRSLEPQKCTLCLHPGRPSGLTKSLTVS